MLGCLADEHISHALVQALRLAGIDAVTVQERGLASADDAAIEAFARADRRLILTNDTDFLRMAAASQGSRIMAPVVFWPQSARRKIRQLVSQILPLAAQDEYEKLCGRVFYL